MTDDELLQRLAEIEGLSWMDSYESGDDAQFTFSVARGYYLPNGVLFKPLTNDAQAMALLKKYLLTVLWSGQWEVVHEGNNSVLSVGEDESLNRAICMAIVEAHSGTER